MRSIPRDGSTCPARPCSATTAPQPPGPSPVVVSTVTGAEIEEDAAAIVAVRAAVDPADLPAEAPVAEDVSKAAASQTPVN